jgi:hypothetical protein
VPGSHNFSFELADEGDERPSEKRCELLIRVSVARLSVRRLAAQLPDHRMHGNSCSKAARSRLCFYAKLRTACVSSSCMSTRCCGRRIARPCRQPRWARGRTARSELSRGGEIKAVRRIAFSDRSRSWLRREVPEISRFSCMLFLSVRGFLDYAEPTGRSRANATNCVAFPLTWIRTMVHAKTLWPVSWQPLQEGRDVSERQTNLVFCSVLFGFPNKMVLMA